MNYDESITTPIHFGEWMGHAEDNREHYIRQLIDMSVHTRKPD